MLQAQKSYLDLLDTEAVLPSSTHRYMFDIDAMQRLLVGPGALNPSILMEKSVAFVRYNLGDVTMMPGMSNPLETLHHMPCTNTPITWYLQIGRLEIGSLTLQACARHIVEHASAYARGCGGSTGLASAQFKGY